MKALRSLAFVTNADKSGAPELARELIALAKAAGLATQQTARRTIPHGWLKGYDACCVIGGDGTLLGVAHEAARAQVPIIGINRGSLGFLTTFSADEARTHFASLLRGQFKIAHRSLLSCTSRLTTSSSKTLSIPASPASKSTPTSNSSPNTPATV